MNSIFSKLRLFVAATCFTSALSFGGSVSGGGGDTLPPNPTGSAGITPFSLMARLRFTKL